MNWFAGKPDSKTGKPYFYVTACGQYYVGIPTIEGGRSLAFYQSPHEAQKPLGKRRPAAILGGFASLEVARKACEDHAYRKRRESA